MSDVLSPDKSMRLTVDADTETTDSGPLTYSETRYKLTVVDTKTNATLVTRNEMSYWDDGASRGRGGLTKWTLTNTELVLEFVDGAVTRVACR